MKTVGIAGPAGPERAALVEALVRELAGRGLSVSTVKEAPEGFEFDKPGKDSFRHREAGAQEVLIASDSRWALVGEGEAPLARLEPVDVVMIEGERAEAELTLSLVHPLLRAGDVKAITDFVVTRLSI